MSAYQLHYKEQLQRLEGAYATRHPVLALQPFRPPDFRLTGEFTVLRKHYRNFINSTLLESQRMLLRKRTPHVMDGSHLSNPAFIDHSEAIQASVLYTFRFMHLSPSTSSYLPHRSRSQRTSAKSQQRAAIFATVRSVCVVCNRSVRDTSGLARSSV